MELPFDYWQVAAFCGPVFATLVVWAGGMFSGMKTNINATFGTFTAGLELVDVSWLPDMYAQPLVTGFAVSTLMANTILTERKPAKPETEPD